MLLASSNPLEFSGQCELSSLVHEVIASNFLVIRGRTIRRSLLNDTWDVSGVPAR